MSSKDTYEVVIIGGGLGGLLCGSLLARNGKRVCVLEQHHKIGGNLQTFDRKGLRFNSAMHYVGAAGKGQILDQVFRYLQIDKKDILEPMDPKAYELVHVGGKRYAMACGLEASHRRLLSYFPEEGPAIERYLSTLQKVWNSTKVLNLEDFRTVYDAETSYTQVNAHEFIDQLTDNPELKALLGSVSALYAGVKDRSPLITHAIIHYHYIQSAWKFRGGSDRLAHALSQSIEAAGGVVRSSQEVTGFSYAGKDICAARLKDESEVKGSAFIANIHPARLAGLVEKGRFRKAYVSRVTELENTPGTFCLYLGLKPGAFPNIPSNVFLYRNREVWDLGTEEAGNWPASCILYTIPDPDSPGRAQSLTASAFMKHRDLAAWEESHIEKRGPDYERFKESRAHALLDLIYRTYPDLEGAIAHRHTASPLTFRDYTGTPEGSAYGILKDCNAPRRSYISPTTRIPNLFLTGQNAGVGLHGVLGVTVSSFFTCAHFLDIGKLLQDIRHA